MAKAATIMLAAGVISQFTAPLAVAQNGTLQICLRNDARVAGDTLDEARRVVSDIYSQAGLTLSWCSDDCTVTIALRPRASDDTARRAQDALGYTPASPGERGRLAFVLINRVNEVANRYGTARSIVLGAAVAHELGHLLISKEHSNTGIMKAYLNQSDFRKARQGELRLTDEQARHIRNSTARVAPSVADNLLSKGCRFARSQSATIAAADAPLSADPRPTLNLELRNMTMLAPAVLAEARETLTQIYRAAGIDVQWKTVPATDFTVYVHIPAASGSTSVELRTRICAGQRKPSAAVKHLSSRIASGTGPSELVVSFPARSRIDDGARGSPPVVALRIAFRRWNHAERLECIRLLEGKTWAVALHGRGRHS